MPIGSIHPSERAREGTAIVVKEKAYMSSLLTTLRRQSSRRERIKTSPISVLIGIDSN